MRLKQGKFFFFHINTTTAYLVGSAPKKEEKEFWEESEWTIGKILMRFVGYGFTMIVLLIGILGIYEGKWKGILPIIISIGICLTYIKSDIQIIREKNRKKELKKRKAVPNKV